MYSVIIFIGQFTIKIYFFFCNIIFLLNVYSAIHFLLRVGSRAKLTFRYSFLFIPKP